MFPNLTALIIGGGALLALPKIYSAWFPNYAEQIIKAINEIAKENAFKYHKKTGMLQWELAPNTGIGTALLLKLIDAVHSYRVWGRHTWNAREEYQKIQAQGGTQNEQNKKLTDIINAKKEALIQALSKDFSQYNLTPSQLRLFYNQVDQLTPIDGPLYTYWWGGRTRADNAKLTGYIVGGTVVGYYALKAYKGHKNA